MQKDIDFMNRKLLVQQEQHEASLAAAAQKAVTEESSTSIVQAELFEALSSGSVQRKGEVTSSDSQRKMNQSSNLNRYWTQRA